MNRLVLSRIASFGIELEEEITKKHNPDLLTSNRNASLSFFLKNTAYGGRRDRLAEIIGANIVLATTDFLNTSASKSMDRYRHHLECWKPTDVAFRRGMLPRPDIERSVGIYEWWSNEGDLKRILEVISKGQIESVYVRLHGIHGVGPKKAKLLLRMLVSLYGLEDTIKKVNAQHLVYAQPIDVWVYRAAKRLELIQTDITEPVNPNKIQLVEQQIGEEIVESCIEVGVSPIKFNEGAWFLFVRSPEWLWSKLSDLDVYELLSREQMIR